MSNLPLYFRRAGSADISPAENEMLQEFLERSADSKPQRLPCGRGNVHYAPCNDELCYSYGKKTERYSFFSISYFYKYNLFLVHIIKKVLIRNCVNLFTFYLYIYINNQRLLVP